MMYILDTLSLIIADHHNKLDTTQIDILFIFMVISCVSIGYFINKLIKESQDD
jgi:hypothetical protein